MPRACGKPLCGRRKAHPAQRSHGALNEAGAPRPTGRATPQHQQPGRAGLDKGGKSYRPGGCRVAGPGGGRGPQVKAAVYTRPISRDTGLTLGRGPGEQSFLGSTARRWPQEREDRGPGGSEKWVPRRSVCKPRKPSSRDVGSPCLRRQYRGPAGTVLPRLHIWAPRQQWEERILG